MHQQLLADQDFTHNPFVMKRWHAIPANSMKTRNFRGEGADLSKPHPTQTAIVSIQCQRLCSQWDWLMDRPCIPLSST